MVTPSPSWNTVRVHGTWVNQNGSMKAGTYTVTMPVRVTNATDNVIVPKGTFDSGPLNVTPGLPSLDVQVPAGDDPDNSPSGFQPVITVIFPDAPGETYVLDIPVALSGDSDGINLRRVILTSTLPTPVKALIRGVAGGIAELDADGAVIDASGKKVTGGGAATTDASALTAGTLPAARIADGSIADAKLASGTSLTAAERTKLAGIATAATANRTDAAVDTLLNAKLAKSANLSDLADAPTARTNLGLGNVNNTTDASKPISTAQQTALDAKAPLASPAFTGSPTLNGSPFTGGGGSSTPAAVYGPRFAFFGDSITNYFETFGIYAAWLSGGKIEPVYVESHAGYTSTQLAALISPAITAAQAQAADVFVIECGTNDAGTGSTATALTAFASNIASMVASVRAAGMVPVLINVPPRNTYASAVSTFNAWLSRYGSTADVKVVDVFSLLADPATGNWQTALTAGEGVHPNAAGNKVIGLALANAITPLIGAPSYQVQPFPGAPNLLPNSLFLTGSTTPTGYGGASGTGITPSLVTDPRGFKWQRLTLSGATGTIAYNGVEIDPGAGTFAVGDKMRYSIRLRLLTDLATPPSVGQGLVSRIVAYTAGYASGINGWNPTGPSLGSDAVTQAGEGLLTVEFTVPANTGLLYADMVAGPMDGTYEHAQPTLLNLTKLGIA